jgi:GTP-binding protein
MSTIVAIVGRPNVGKSTLYNRLVGQRDAITDNVSGVTRDRKYGTCEWNGKRFIVVDTGGFAFNSEDGFDGHIREQVKFAIQEANIIIFMTDAQTGVTDLDETVADMLRKSKKPIFLAVNKSDNFQDLINANEFWSLGFEQTHFLASISGSGTGEILDEICQLVTEDSTLETDLPKFTIVGRPNVGKSSFSNALLGEERNIVSEKAGTTRDSNHSHYNKFGLEFILIDTAGLRKRTKVDEDLEFYSVMRAIKAIEESDVCILMIDATLGIESQELNILHVASSRHKGIVILVNKWDLMEKETNTARDFEQAIKARLKPFDDIPILFVSALDKQRIFKAIEVTMDVFRARQQKIKTSELNDVMLPLIDAYPPPSVKGRFAKFKFVTQLPTPFPAFAFFVNNPAYVKESYRQFLENKMREHYNFTGVPIELFIRAK